MRMTWDELLKTAFAGDEWGQESYGSIPDCGWLGSYEYFENEEELIRDMYQFADFIGIEIDPAGMENLRRGVKNALREGDKFFIVYEEDDQGFREIRILGERDFEFWEKLAIEIDPFEEEEEG